MKKLNKVNQRELAEHLGIDQGNLSKWLLERGYKSPYNQDEIRKRYIKELGEKAAGRCTEGDLDPMQERARKDKAMADKYERENAIAQGKLHDGEEVTHYIANANPRARRKEEPEESGHPWR